MTAASEVAAAIANGLKSSPDAPSRSKKGRDPNRKRHGARNQHKMKHFCKWLLDTFPDETSQCAAAAAAAAVNEIDDNNVDNDDDDDESNIRRNHILDVAGGKGELAARLCMCHGRRVCMVDPRQANIAHCFASAVLPKIPKKWQERLQAQRAVNPEFISDTVSKRFRQLVMPLDEYTLSTCADLQQAVQQAALLVGMHADGATEAIVELALQHGTPFVVVPCCVFPNLFHERRVVTKQQGVSVPVRTHEQFCEYLLQKHPGFQSEILPFDGRNIAIWWDGKS